MNVDKCVLGFLCTSVEYRAVKWNGVDWSGKVQAGLDWIRLNSFASDWIKVEGSWRL